MISEVLENRRSWWVENAHVLTGLAMLPDGCISTCCTSIPYWGLRSYSTEPQVWGGDKNCEHEWGIVSKAGYGSTQGYANNPEGFRNGKINRHVGYETKAGNKIETQLCRFCGAWRGELGLEPDPALFVEHIVQIFQEVKRVLHPSGTLWLNIGDSYVAGPTGRQDGPIKRDRQHLKEYEAKRGGNPRGRHKLSDHPEAYANTTTAMIAKGGRYRVDNMRKDAARHFGNLPPKSLMMMPARVALALQEDGWLLRSEITWCKRAPMPESCQDRPTSATEKIYLFAKQGRYFYDQDAIRERNGNEADWGEYIANGRGEWGGNFVNGVQTTHRTGAGKPVYTHPNGRNAWNYWLLSPEPNKLSLQTSRRVPVERDAVTDGTEHIRSVDCPVHGDHPAPLPTAQYGQRVDGSESRNGHTDTHPSTKQQPVGASNTPTPSPESAGQSLDLQGQPCAPSATDHSNGNHKTDPAPVTSPAYNVSAQTESHTEHTLELPAPSDLVEHKHESNIASDDSGAPLSAQTTSHTASTFSLPIPPECICQFYTETTENTSHFATFPTEIPRRAILAGSSERGVCPTCLAPWRRVVERGGLVFGDGHTRPNNRVKTDGGNFDAWSRPDGLGKTQVPGAFYSSTTTGWLPGCTHQHEPIGALVLDPFSGSGTTGLVAKRLGRRYIGFDLQPEYVAMSRERIANDAPLLEHAEQEEREARATQMELGWSA